MRAISDENFKYHFAVMAIEASAKLMGITPAQMHERLDRVGLIEEYILGCFDSLHCQSLQHVAEDVVEALHNWEAKRQDKEGSL